MPNKGKTDKKVLMKSINFYLKTFIFTGAMFASATAMAQCPSITTQPTNVSACSGSNITFTVAATGSSLQYQWQEKTAKGLVFLNISSTNTAYSGVNTSQLGVSSVGPAQSGNQYRCVITGNVSCTPPDVVTNHVTLTVNDYTTITMQPSDTIKACDQVDVQISAKATGGNLTYQWQEDLGMGFVDISGGSYAGEQSATLTVITPGPGLSGRKFRAVISGICGSPDTTNESIILVSTFPQVTMQPEPDTAIELTNARFTVAATGTDIKYNWQENSNSGTWVYLFDDAAHSGSKTPTLTVRTDLSKNNYSYRCVVTGNCTGDTSTPAPLSVQPDLSVATSAAHINRFVLYPNPVNGTEINLFAKENTQFVTVNILDVLGRIISEQRLNFYGQSTGKLDVSTLEKGIYTIRVLNEEHVPVAALRFTKN